MVKRNTILTLMAIVGVMLILPFISTLSITTQPGGSPTAIFGLVVNNGLLVTSGNIDCRSGGVSRTQGGPSPIGSDGRFDIVCLGGSVLEFFVNDVKYDTTWNVRAFGEPVGINIIKGNCGSYCNPPVEPLSCSWYIINGAPASSENMETITTGMLINKRGFEFGPATIDTSTNRYTCENRCVLVDKELTRGVAVCKIDGEVLKRNNEIYRLDDAFVDAADAICDEVVCYYQNAVKPFHRPSNRPDCKFCQELYELPTPDEDLECTSDAECGTGYGCVSSSCIQLTCPVCGDTTEWAGCNGEVESRSTFSCDISTNFECQERMEFKGCAPEVDCEVDSECNDDYICSEGSCIPDVECSNDTQCAENFVCESNQCIPEVILPEIIDGEDGTYLDNEILPGFTIFHLLIGTLGILTISLVVAKK